MSAIPGLRRRRTSIVAAAAIGGLVAAATMVYVGAATLNTSEEGTDAIADELAVIELPVTPTAALGVLGDDGELASVAVLVLLPGGIGGSIVSFPATADVSQGFGDDRSPLDEVVALDGPEAFAPAIETMLGVSIQQSELLDGSRLADLLAPLGDVVVDLPVDVIDPDRAESDVLFPAGRTTMSSDDVAEVLTAVDPDRPLAEQLDQREAVWDAIDTAVGEGRPPLASHPAGTTENLLDLLFAGDVGARGLQSYVPPPEANPRGVDVVVLDRAEVLLVFAQVAPRAVAAPNVSLSFQIISGFTDDDLAELGINNADVSRDAINRLLFAQANVISVSRVRAGAVDDTRPDVTEVYVPDQRTRDIFEESFTTLFGRIVVKDATYRVEGVDVIVVLGRSYLDKIASDGFAGANPSTTVTTEATEDTAPGATSGDSGDSADTGGTEETDG
jgi:hypothetical protein